MRAHLRTAFILALTLGLLAFFFRNADLGQVWVEMRAANLALVAVAALVNFVTYPLRTLRWQYLLAPVGRVRFGSALSTTIIGFAASVILPARAGEVLRPYLLARRERLSATSAFATVVLERVLDLVMVLLLLGAFLLTAAPGRGPFHEEGLRAVRAGGLAAALAAVGLLILFGALAGHPDWLVRLVHRLERRLPVAAGRVAPLVERFTAGLATVRQPRRLLTALALSVPLWLTIAAGIWVMALAFHMTVPYVGSFLIVAILVIGVAVPTPGAIGGFHAAFEMAVTSFYGVSADRAVGGAIVLHAASFLPVVLAGAALMVHEGLTLSRMRAMAARPPDDAAPAPIGPDGEVGAVGEPEGIK